jgi:hypothetical protein
MTTPNSHTAICALLVILLVACVAQAQETPDAEEILEALEGEEWMEDPSQIMSWVELPRTVKQGDTFDLLVTIENGRTEDAFRLSEIFLGESFIAGFKILDLSPPPRNKDKSLGDWALEYPTDIPAGETREFQIRLRAKASGVFIGDIDIYEGERFLTRAAQTRVR